jgi:hypothetical protein
VQARGRQVARRDALHVLGRVDGVGQHVARVGVAGGAAAGLIFFETNARAQSETGIGS